MKEIFMKGIVLTVLILIPFSTFSDYRQDIPIIDWIAAYNYPGNSVDVANALAVDHAGNVYVTGYSDELGTFSVYTTIKYDMYVVK